jgi:hypothetical protein
MEMEKEFKIDYDQLVNWEIPKEVKKNYSLLVKNKFKNKKTGIKTVTDFYSAIGLDLNQYNNTETVKLGKHGDLLYAPLGVNDNCEYGIYANDYTNEKVRALIKDQYKQKDSRYILSMLGMDWLYISPITDDTLPNDVVVIKKNPKFKKVETDEKI